ncbi:MAG: hypothetical protein SFZ02_19690 [bacterium]|nr:hypothetical protein [bacterium]
MKLVLRFFTIGMLNLLVFGMATSTQPAWACSGIGPTVEDLLDSEFIVIGNILWLDDSGKNGVMEVYEYLKGQGKQTLTLSSYTPRQIMRDKVYSRSGCNYGTSMRENTEVIMFLSKNLDGSYHPSQYYYTNNQRILWSLSLPTYVESLAELRDAIIGYLQTQPTNPIGGYYQLNAPLLITSESGSQYLLPVDKIMAILLEENQTRFIPEEQSACWEFNCVAISSADTIEIKNGEITFGQGVLNPQTISANAFMLSPTPPFIAIWRENKIQIFRMHSILDDSSRITLVTETPLYTIIPNSAVWSPNGQFLVFADDRGIMLWDVFVEGAEPILIYDTDIKRIQGFSPLGRFLVIGDTENGISIDLISGETYPVGVFSPTENYLMSYNNELFQFIPRQFQDMSELYSPIHKIQWLSNNSWIALACNSEDNPASCNIIRENTGISSEAVQTHGYAFDYDMQNRSLVMVVDEFQINIEQTLGQSQYINTMHYNYDLSPYLDSPIASIEWLPSLFYYDD